MAEGREGRYRRFGCAALSLSASQIKPASLLSLQDHFRVLHHPGGIDDLNCLSKLVAEARAALAAVPPDEFIRAAYHNSLGTHLRWISDKTRSLRDTDEAVDHSCKAVAQLRYDNLTRLLYQSHLARSLCSCFTLSGHATYLDEAVTKGRDITGESPLVYPSRATHWDNMAHVLATKFLTPWGTMADIEEAIECAKKKSIDGL